MMRKKKSITNAYFLVPLCFVLLQYALFYFCAKFLCMPYGPFNLETLFDTKVPFLPGFIYIYVGSYLFWLISFIYIALKDKESFYGLAACITVTFFVSFLIFVFMPTTIVRPAAVGCGFTQSLVEFIYNADSPPLNLFPSMHCLASWLCYIYMRRIKTVPKPIKLICMIFAIAVFASTQFVKQHYIADVFGGVILAEAGAIFVRKAGIGQITDRCFTNLNKKIFGIHIKHGEKIQKS